MGLNTINHFAIQYNVTLGRPLKSGQHTQCGGLTTTRRPDEAGDLAAIALKRNIIQHRVVVKSVRYFVNYEHLDTLPLERQHATVYA